jgi:hypothetical protein
METFLRFRGCLQVSYDQLLTQAPTSKKARSQYVQPQLKPKLLVEEKAYRRKFEKDD